VRVLLAGTPEIALQSLEAIHRSRHDLVGVLTAPDRQAGRGRRVIPPPVKARALELGLPTLQPERVRTEAREQVAALKPEILACVAHGRIYGPKFIALFPYGTLNLHPSLLPRYRGPAPVAAPILNGDREAGVTIQRLALEVDAGDILAQEAITLDGTETTGTLTVRLGELGARLLVSVLDAIESGNASEQPQDHSQASYTTLVTKEDGHIDWAEPAELIARKVRAYDPWPRTFTLFGGRRLNVLKAVAESGQSADGSADTHPGRVIRVDTALGILVETGNGLLALQRLQLQSRKPLDWRSFLNGVRDFVGSVLGG
jgi:methionyl-tRNA formyltransferase